MVQRRSSENSTVYRLNFKTLQHSGAFLVQERILRNNEVLQYCFVERILKQDLNRKDSMSDAYSTYSRNKLQHLLVIHIHLLVIHIHLLVIHIHLLVIHIHLLVIHIHLLVIHIHVVVIHIHVVVIHIHLLVIHIHVVRLFSMCWCLN